MNGGTRSATKTDRTRVCKVQCNGRTAILFVNTKLLQKHSSQSWNSFLFFFSFARPALNSKKAVDRKNATDYLPIVRRVWHICSKCVHLTNSDDVDATTSKASSTTSTSSSIFVVQKQELKKKFFSVGDSKCLTYYADIFAFKLLSLSISFHFFGFIVFLCPERIYFLTNTQKAKKSLHENVILKEKNEKRKRSVLLFPESNRPLRSARINSLTTIPLV